MFYRIISTTLSIVLTCALLPVLAAAKQTSQEAKFKQKIVGWGTNKQVAVELNSGQKFKGRIANIQDDLFTVQIVQQGQISSREVRYQEIKKISDQDGSKAGKVIGYTTIGVLAGLGIFALGVLVIQASN